MITLIHGENTTESRKFFIDTKQKYPTAITLEGSTATMAMLSEKLEGQGLFDDTKILFIEELISKRKSQKDIEALLKFVIEHGNGSQIYLWESKQLTPKQISHFKTATIKKYDLPKEIFVFLDSIAPQNTRKAIEAFHKTLETEDAEFIFFMLVRQIRMLISILEQGEAQIDELKRVAPWQMAKLQKQANAFGKEKLIELFHQLFILEQGLKTGKNSLKISQMIDFLLASL